MQLKIFTLITLFLFGCGPIESPEQFQERMARKAQWDRERAEGILKKLESCYPKCRGWADLYPWGETRLIPGDKGEHPCGTYYGREAGCLISNRCLIEVLKNNPNRILGFRPGLPWSGD